MREKVLAYLILFVPSPISLGIMYAKHPTGQHSVPTQEVVCPSERLKVTLLMPGWLMLCRVFDFHARGRSLPVVTDLQSAFMFLFALTTIFQLP